MLSMPQTSFLAQVGAICKINEMDTDAKVAGD